MVQEGRQQYDGRGVLADLTHYRTYPALKHDRRKETREEVITRVKRMHQTKFPWLEREIEEVFAPVYLGLAVPSMRSLQFGGMPVFRSNARIYNCSYAPLTEWKDFADLFWLLLNGVGVGYSVKQRHVSQLPVVSEGVSGQVFLVPDSKEGWADAILGVLHNPLLKCDTRLVRPRGAPLTTGGIASGPGPLMQAVENVRSVLLGAVGRQLTSVEAFDIMCYIADVVVVGAVRRAATICQFDYDDEGMLQAKTGEWYIKNPQRMRANISVSLEREFGRSNPGIIRDVLAHTFNGGAGEPGIILTGHPDWGRNPCAEIELRPRGFCNLSEVNVAATTDLELFFLAVQSAAAIGTLQATYTDFEYIHPDWKKNAEEEALLGVSMTGQAMNWDMLRDDVLQAGADFVLETNLKWAEMLDIAPAARATTVKPSGNTSAWLGGITSGIHAAHSDYFLRRVRVDRKDDLGEYLIENYGENLPESGHFVETDKFNSENIVITVPIAMEGAIKREDESAIDLLERCKHVYQNWVLPGHVSGHGTHNVSLTVNFRPGEEQEITDWMVDNQDSWAGISLLPYDGGTYVQAPFEEITKEEYEAWLERVPQDLDFTNIVYPEGYIDVRVQEAACVGGACEIQ